MSFRRPAVLVVALLVACAGSIFIASPAYANTITVNTTDGGSAAGNGCSLAEAITAANGNAAADQCTAGSSVGHDVIAFNIPGDGPHTITPSPALPLVGTGVTIDGTTEPGYTGTPLIELNGQNAGNGATGLSLPGNGITIRALAINRFGGSGINISGSTNVVDSSFIGTDVTGTVDLGNGDGISVTGAGNFIGQTDTNLPTLVGLDQYRNVISGNGTPQAGGSGVFISGPASGNVVVRSNIGTTADGTQALGNGNNGVLIFGSSLNTVGSAAPTLNNVIGGNSGIGVDVSNAAGMPPTISANNTVMGNYIGTNATGADLGNDNSGVTVAGADNTVGGTETGQGNVIAYNGNATFSGRGGVTVRGDRQSVIGNSIYDNDTLGIDLGGDGVTPNDEDDVDTGHNDLQNFPEIYGATEVDSKASLKTTLDGESNTEYRIEFFRSPTCDNNATGHGEGKVFWEATEITTGPEGFVDFTRNFDDPLPSGAVLTATATKVIGDNPGPTSEFSPCFVAPESDVELTKSGPASVKLNKPFTYTLTVTNDGPDPVTDVLVLDDLPAGTDLMNTTLDGNATKDCLFIDGTVGCDLGPMGDGESHEVKLRVRLLTPGTFVNGASVTIGHWDPDLTNNEDEVETQGTCDKKGNAQANTINGTAGADVLCGLAGNDTINGKGGKDFIVAGGGKDVAKGGGKADILYGNGGRDSLYGNAGGDDLYGGGGSDLCRQGSGSGTTKSCER